MRRMIRTYRRTLPRDRRNLLESYRYVHAARKVVGVGSVGARTWILLLVGRDDDDPLFLQFKEAQRSVLEPFLGRSQYAQHGQRVVEGQRMMQAAPDILLGWERISTIDGEERDFYIRQLWNAKGSADVELMDPSTLEAYGANLRLDARAGPRALGRQDRHRGLPRQGSSLRSRDGLVRRGIRRPERTGLPRSRGGRGGRAASRLRKASDRPRCRLSLVGAARPPARPRTAVRVPPGVLSSAEAAAHDLHRRLRPVAPGTRRALRPLGTLLPRHAAAGRDALRGVGDGAAPLRTRMRSTTKSRADGPEEVGAAGINMTTLGAPARGEGTAPGRRRTGGIASARGASMRPTIPQARVGCKTCGASPSRSGSLEGKPVR